MVINEKYFIRRSENFQGFFFLRFPEYLKVGGGQRGYGGSEKHIWKIFYGGDTEIGTPGTPWGSQGTNFFPSKFFSLKVTRVYVGRFVGCYGKKK